MKVSLRNLFLKYKIQILFTFFLLTIESVLLVFIPYAIGLSIDSLSNGTFKGLYILGFVLLLILIFSTSRRIYDTRVYSKVYALLCTKLIKNHKKKNIDTSIIVTRSNLVQELVDFFEHNLTEAYTSLIGIFGALLMILYLDAYVFAVCLVSIIMISIIYQLSEKKIFKENEKLNTELENRLNTIKNKNIFLVNHFRRIAHSMIRLSDIESYNYIVIQILIGTVIFSALFIGVRSNLSAGDIFAMLTYVLNFSFEVLTLPIIFQQFIRLKEITNRINKEGK